MSEFVTLKDVRKIYKMGEVEIMAAAGIDFEIKKGEFAVVVGPSGAGKTTVLNILGGMDTATSGQVLVDGQDIATYSTKQLTAYRRDDIGFVFQFYNLIPVLNVKENITLDEALAQISFLKKQVKVLGEKAFKSENKYEEAKQQVEDLTVQNKELQVNYNWILEQLKLSKKKMYGASAEKIAEEYGQLNLFNEAELERQPMQAEPQIEEITYTRKKSKKKSITRCHIICESYV